MGHVLVARRPLKKSALLQLGDRITVLVEAPPKASPNSQTRLMVRLESSHWVIVSKPAGQPTAPRNTSELDALANALVAAYPEMANVGHHALEPGLLHRLDNGTSGLLVAARRADAFEAASEALKQGGWTKHYLALVHGSDLPPAGTIVGHLQADRRRPRRVIPTRGVAVTPLPAESIWNSDLEASNRRAPAAPHRTRFLVLRTLGNVAFVEVAVGAAFRHQIRAHFSAAGWPLLNDEVYAAGAESGLPPGRHALHAARVAWSGGGAFPGFDVEEPLPDDLAELLRTRGGGAP